MDLDNKPTIELLNNIYENSKTAVEAINILISATNSYGLKTELREKYNEYCRIVESTSVQLLKYNEIPKENIFSEIFDIWASVRLPVYIDKSTASMAEIIINGSSSGMIDLFKCIHKNPDADIKAIETAKELISLEESSIEGMKYYL